MNCTHALGHNGPCPHCARIAKAKASAFSDRTPAEDAEIAERHKIVRWLRTQGPIANTYADAIDNGDHNAR